MSINWTRTQQNVTTAGYPCGNIDGVPGRMTFASLFACAAGRRVDAVLLAIGGAAALPGIGLGSYGITDTPARLRSFIAETCNETGGYTRFEENLHYSAKRIMQVWPSRFPTLASAQPYAWDPSDPDREDIALANRVYGSRMGNEVNGTNDNDGWETRGSGMLQHTGLAEYLELRKIGLTPDDVRDPAKSVHAACDFWRRRNLNRIVDTGDIRAERKAVNGGYIGVDEVDRVRTKLVPIIV